MRSSSGPGNRVDRVRGADEQHLRQVERQVEVVVAERRVLLGVEHLEHRAGGIAAPVVAHLVDLVDQDQRVRRLGVAQRAHDRARHRADVRAAVAADLRLVAHAADGQAHELASERARDRLAERRLADAGRADEAEDLARRPPAAASRRRGTRRSGPSPSRGRSGRGRARRARGRGRGCPRCTRPTAA